MKRTITTLFAVAALAATVVSIFPLKHGASVLPVVHAQNQNQGGGCSLASLNGAYAVDKQGTLLTQPPGPYGEASIAHFNGAGSFFGNATVNLGGTALNPAFTGTYTVNSDCTGTVTVRVPTLGLTLRDAIVVIGGGQRYIGTAIDSTEVVQARAERIGN
jgi:hypothetical protein